MGLAPAGVLGKGTIMGKMIREFARTVTGMFLLLTVLTSSLPGALKAQMTPSQQQWQQQQQARQMYERQQFLQWQSQEQARQMAERQKWLQWQQQEKIRQMFQR